MFLHKKSQASPLYVDNCIFYATMSTSSPEPLQGPWLLPTFRVGFLHVESLLHCSDQATKKRNTSIAEDGDGSSNASDSS
jgi:hypothetical protein